MDHVSCTSPLIIPLFVEVQAVLGERHLYLLAQFDYLQGICLSIASLSVNSPYCGAGKGSLEERLIHGMNALVSNPSFSILQGLDTKLGIYRTGNPVHLPNPNPYPTRVLTNPNFQCRVFQLH